MSAYSGLIAARLGLNAEEIHSASWLHDVGMTALTITGRTLSRDDRARMEMHTEIGQALLLGSGSESLDLAAEIAWTHHECFDGSGYPRGLRGEAIPRVGRIVAVADAFDAITTDREYRAAQNVGHAVRELEVGATRQFDPLIVAAFIDGLEDALSVLAHFPEPTSATSAHQDLLSVAAACALLQVSPSRVRRWADQGLLRAVRTAGGHRRFLREEVLSLAGRQGTLPVVRPVDPPAEPLPGLSLLLASSGRRFTAAAAQAVYRHGPTGWFASPQARATLHRWLDALIDGCETGRYRGAVVATRTLMSAAQTSGASPLERYGFLERFGQLARRQLEADGEVQAELAGARRLIVSLQQSLLEAQ